MVVLLSSSVSMTLAWGTQEKAANSSATHLVTVVNQVHAVSVVLRERKKQRQQPGHGTQIKQSGTALSSEDIAHSGVSPSLIAFKPSEWGSQKNPTRTSSALVVLSGCFPFVICTHGVYMGPAGKDSRNLITRRYSFRRISGACCQNGAQRIKSNKVCSQIMAYAGGKLDSNNP